MSKICVLMLALCLSLGSLSFAHTTVREVQFNDLRFQPVYEGGVSCTYDRGPEYDADNWPPCRPTGYSSWLSGNIYINPNALFFNYQTSDGYPVKMRCDFDLPYLSEEDRKITLNTEMTNVPAGYADDASLPYDPADPDGSKHRRRDDLSFFVKKENQTRKVIAHSWEEAKGTHEKCEREPYEEEPYCTGFFKYHRIGFKVPFGSTQLGINCSAELTAKSKDSIDMSINTLNVILANKVILK